jgi:anti-sigma regulatory factor (Ser/Thr protein kinase)
MSQSQTTAVKILEHLRGHPNSRSADLVALTGLSRQRIAQHLTALIEAGKVMRDGSTKNARYTLATQGKEYAPSKVELVKTITGLEEDRVFDEVDLRLNLRKSLSDTVYRIVYYAFTEMLNNAIDHSGADHALIQLALSESKVTFAIRDRGIGAFANLQKNFGLASEFEAIEHLQKGKQTTFPEQHSGQGIFFTSRIADRFILRSHKLELLVDNNVDDLFAGDRRNLQGTLVEFEIRRHSRKSLKRLFDEFSNADFEFDRTNMRLKLTAQRELLSRSQAKRIVLGLEAYEKIVFDFADVKMIGQAFADEIFRVFQNRNPKMELTFCNTNEAVTGMILRAVRSPHPKNT